MTVLASNSCVSAIAEFLEGQCWCQQEVFYYLCSCCYNSAHVLDACMFCVHKDGGTGGVCVCVLAPHSSKS